MPTVTAAELYFGVPIVKTEKAADGSLLVHGRATDGSLDLDDQIVDPAFARRALKEWFDDWGNVRQMHSGGLPPAGVGIELTDAEDGQWLKSKVYEPGAVKQVEEGGYKAYSVGIARPRIVRDSSAPNGRIVDGVVVEVSLVDRPANPSCKFAITKGVGDGMRVIGKAVSVGPAGLDLAKVAADTGLAQVRVEWFLGKSALGSKDQREGAKHKLRGSDGEAKYPINDCADVEDAWGLRGHAARAGLSQDRVERHIRSAARAEGCPVPGTKDAKSEIAKSPARMCPSCGVEAKSKHTFCASCGKKLPDTGADTDKAATPRADLRPPLQPGEAPYALRRLHDACCAAYPTEAVREAYPVLEKDGIAAALGPGAKLALWQMLNQEVQEDAGTGSEALDIHHMGEAYKHLCEFIQVEAGQAVDSGDGDAQGGSLIMLAAHSDLHAAFAELNKDIMPSGGPSIPSAAGAGQIQPGQFRRPYIAAGHQRENGVGAGSPSMPARTHDVAATDFQRPALSDGQERQSPGNAKRAAVTAMQDLHDRIALQFPEMCPMDLAPARVANQDQAMPQRVQLGASPDAVKAADQAERKLAKAARRGRKAKRLEKALRPHLDTIKELQATVDRLSREPDPAAAAHRGVIVTKAADPQALKRAGEDVLAHETHAWLEEQAMHADPQVRLRAQGRLAAIEKAAQPALTS